jgi:outer membrane protein W
MDLITVPDNRRFFYLKKGGQGMKNNLITSFFVVATLVLIFGQISFAEDMKGRVGLGARLAHVDYVEHDDEPDDAVMYGINLTYFAHRYFSFELSADYTESDVELSVLGLSGNDGDLTQVPVLLTGRMHFSTNPKVSPYFGGGVGYYFNSIDSDRAVAKTDVDNSIGYHVSAGVEIFVAENAAINLDFRYIWNKIDAEVKPPGFADGEFDLNAFVAGLGFKYYF